MLMPGRIVPCVGAVILDEQDRVLLVKHVPEKGGFWAGKYIRWFQKNSPQENTNTIGMLVI